VVPIRCEILMMSSYSWPKKNQNSQCDFWAYLWVSLVLRERIYNMLKTR
jgi:hypothetical protein